MILTLRCMFSKQANTLKLIKKQITQNAQWSPALNHSNQSMAEIYMQ